MNPDNPVINVRSFGEEPEDVARFVAATVEGLQAGGVVATLLTPAQSPLKLQGPCGTQRFVVDLARVACGGRPDDAATCAPGDC